jgi:L-arabinose isomerase
MTARASGRPKIGVLALSLELYESLAPGLRQGRERWLRKALLPALKPDVDPVFHGAVFTREQVDAAVTDLERAGADALLVVLLAYSPSQIALPSLRRTHLPIAIWNTQELFGVDETYDGPRLSANHGVHGTQDLCNVLLRSGVKFAYVTSHPKDTAATRELVDFFTASAAVSKLRKARIGLLGYPFPGMGDFAVDTTHMTASLGCEWINLPMEEYIQRAAAARIPAVSRLVRTYRQAYDVAKDVAADDLEATARVEIALRGMVEQYQLAAMTYQFMAFGADERTPTVPFVAASRLMAEGIGFGGEGDLIAAAGTSLLNWLAPPASFSEIFTIDFAGNSVLMSHMGEANVAMARKDRKVALVARHSPITRTQKGQLALVTTFEPGPATLMALTLGPNSRWRIIASPMMILDFGPLSTLQVPHCKLSPAGDVRDFLTAYATAGGPHHSAICFGDARGRLRHAAKMLDADYCEV